MKLFNFLKRKEIKCGVLFYFQVCIVFGIFLMVLSPIGGLRTIVIQAKEYKFYS